MNCVVEKNCVLFLSSAHFRKTKCTFSTMADGFGILLRGTTPGELNENKNAYIKI